MSLAPRTPEKAMADGNRALQEVGALAAERRRFESWIAALEARRDSTPAHVFERVLRDYRERLDRVNEQLGSHQVALEDERASLASRLALLEGEEQMRRDERAELELRAHVGELSDAETGASFASLDEALKQLASERQSLESSLAGLRELLAAGDDQRVGALDQRHHDQASSDDQRVGGLDQRHPEQANSDAGDQVLRPFDHDPEPPQGDPLTDLVRQNTTEASLLDDLLDPPVEPGAAQPLAANVPANTPIVLRPSGPIEQSKTLKCQECGALNYPTEWYCERCGAELAAL